MSTQPSPVVMTHDGGVATITLSRPDAMNSLDVRTKEELLSALRGAGQLDLFISVSYLLLLGFVGTLMMIEAVRTFLRRRAGIVTRDKLPSQHTWMHGLPMRIRFKKSRLYISVLPVLGIGVFIGWVGALLGIGGGIAFGNGRRDRRQDSIVGKRLFDEIGHAGFQRLNGHGHVGMAGDDDHGNANAKLGEFFDQLHPGHVRHANVGDDATGLCQPAPGQGAKKA